MREDIKSFHHYVFQAPATHDSAQLYPGENNSVRKSVTSSFAVMEWLHRHHKHSQYSNHANSVKNATEMFNNAFECK